MLEQYSHEQSVTKAFINFAGPYPTGSRVSPHFHAAEAGQEIHTA